jgi:cold shock CspA family protein
VGGPVAAAGPRFGRVASFDATRGLGTVRDDAGEVFGFHATAIADGTRSIDVGTPVTFSLAPGHGGRSEARTLVVCPQEPTAPPPAPHQRPS